MDLKYIREKVLKMTQPKLAEYLDVDQSNISRWEKNPKNIPLEVIDELIKLTRIPYEELTGWKNHTPDPLEIRDTYDREKVIQQYSDAAEFLEKNASSYGSFSADTRKYLQRFAEGLDKPRVTVAGRINVGKSTVINALIGADIMPSSPKFSTSIPIYLRHTEDKPPFIGEDVLILKERCGDEELWDDRKIYDKDYCRKWKIGAGGTEILRSFATDQGEGFKKGAGAAVVFVDAPILKNCVLIDLPGFESGPEGDNRIAFSIADKADAVLYLSPAERFMEIDDITYLKRIIHVLPVWERKGENELPPISNVFVIASQAHTVGSGSREQLEEILDIGCSNVSKTLSDKYWMSRQERSGYDYSANGKAELRARFFAYAVELPEICQPFNSDLTRLVEALPPIVRERAGVSFKKYADVCIAEMQGTIKKCSDILKICERSAAIRYEPEKDELIRMRENAKWKNEIREEISRLRDESIDEFYQYAQDCINTDAIAELMKKKGVRNKRTDVELFAGYLQSMTQERCETILKQKSEALSEKIRKSFSEYSKLEPAFFDRKAEELRADVSRAIASDRFFSYAIGSGLSLFFSALIPPLGGILVGSLAAAKLVGGGWEKSAAKKFAAAFRQNNFTEKFCIYIHNFWDQTEDNFNLTASKLNKELNAYAHNISGQYAEELKQKIEQLNSLLDTLDSTAL